MPEIKLVIFDCDGVLVDSEFLAARHEARRYGEQGFELSVEEFSGRFAGMTGELISRDIEEELGRKLPQGFYKEIERELDVILQNEVEAIEGIVEALDRIGLPRCICSNSGPDRLKLMLKRTGLHDLFRPYIYSAKELDPPAPKPRPDIFLHAMKEFNAGPRETVIIEDSVHGVAAAKAAGARIIGFTGGRHSYPFHGEKLSDAGAETIIASHGLLSATIDAMSIWDGEF
jgi:HAD superfamily hydrolase (TIGR01509 family)